MEKMDIHSWSRPDFVRVRHIELDLDVHFDRRVLDGSGTIVGLHPYPRTVRTIRNRCKSSCGRNFRGAGGEIAKWTVAFPVMARFARCRQEEEFVLLLHVSN